MDINAIDKALDSAIALLMCGSGVWLACTLPVFIITRSKASVENQASQTNLAEAEIGSISIEVSPVESNRRPLVPERLVAESPEPLEDVKVAVQPAKLESLPTITCEPVNWKKWKVGDLRQSSITQVCGVRVSPIGSKRKLRKADLIAQYEQNLKRMTCEQPSLTVKSEKIA